MMGTDRMNVVLIDASDVRSTRIATALGRDGHRVVGLSSTESMEDEVGIMPINLLLLCLDTASGLDLIGRFRRAQPFAGIVAYTVSGQHGGRLDAYKQGADMCLEDPADLDELVAAVGAMGRRLQNYGELGLAPHAATLSLDQLSMQLWSEKGRVSLSDAEAALLSALARAPGHVLETWQINELLGLEFGEHSKANLEVRIVRLRSKLAQAGANRPSLRAVRLHGYQLCVPLQVV